LLGAADAIITRVLLVAAQTTAAWMNGIWQIALPKSVRVLFEHGIYGGDAAVARRPGARRRNWLEKARQPFRDFWIALRRWVDCFDGVPLVFLIRNSGRRAGRGRVIRGDW